LVYGTGERLGLIDDNGQHLFNVLGIGNMLWRGEEPHVVRVGENKYVGFVIEDDCPNTSPCTSTNWYQFKEISVYSFFDDVNYNVGQKIGNIQFNPSVSSAQAPTGIWIFGDTLSLSGSTANIFLADRDFNYIQVNELVNN
jgi:hypothetical protein